MTVLLFAVHSLFGILARQLLAPSLAVALACALLSPLVSGQNQELRALTQERQALTTELEQYQKTLDILHSADTPAAQSDNPAVRTLAGEVARISERLLTITRLEVPLLQQQISAASTAAKPATPRQDSTPVAPPQNEAIENKPLHTINGNDALVREADEVQRLQGLLANYYTQMQESSRTMPSKAELDQREAARVDAQKLAKIPFSVDKVRLNGAEGSTALSQITERLNDPALAESRRDIAPICSIKTHLYGSLVGSDSRSLKPVGKNHFVARIRLQPGDTSLRIRDQRWELRLPQNVSANDFLITYYNPPGSIPELHIFAVDDLLAEDDPHIPAWLPDDLKITSRAG